MDDLESLRKMLEEPLPRQETRDRARNALRARYSASTTRPRSPVGRILTVAAGVLVASFLLLVVVQPDVAGAWSPFPVTPPDPSLVRLASDECVEAGSAPGDLLLLDQRGDVAVALFGGSVSDRESRGFRTCTLVAQNGRWERAGADDLPYTLAVTAGAVDEEVLGQRVESVIINLPTEEVEVSYQDGFYLIWWPESVALSNEMMRFVADDGSIVLEVPVRRRWG